MFSIQDQLSIATRNNIESQFAMMTLLSNKTFDGIERLCTLNITAARASIDEWCATMRQVLAAQGPSEILSLSMAQIQPNIEKVIAYACHVAHITSGTQAEFIKAAEVQFDEIKRNMTQLIDDLAKSAPAGSKATVDIVRSVIETASAGYEQVARNAKQTVAVVGGTLDATANRRVSETTVVADD